MVSNARKDASFVLSGPVTGIRQILGSRDWIRPVDLDPLPAAPMPSNTIMTGIPALHSAAKAQLLGSLVLLAVRFLIHGFI